MAVWKRLTRTGSLAEKVDVNLEAIAYMQWYDDATTIVFVGSSGDRLVNLAVKEKPGDIHAMPTQPSRIAPQPGNSNRRGGRRSPRKKNPKRAT
jgi:hypothetical protein